MARFYTIGRFVLTGLVALILIPVGGEFFIEFARKRGLYEHPSETVGAVMDKMIAIADLPWFKSVALLLTGLTIGMWFDTLARKRARRVPVVKEWLHPLQAVERFVDPDLVLKNTNAQNIAQDLSTKSLALTGEIQRTSTVDLEILASKGKAHEYEALKQRSNDAWQASKAAEFTARLHKAAVMENFVDQLRNGRLVAKGHAVKNGELQEHEQHISPVFWKIIQVDRDILDPETAKASGPYAAFENVSIGENIRFGRR